MGLSGGHAGVGVPEGLGHLGYPLITRAKGGQGLAKAAGVEAGSNQVALAPGPEISGGKEVLIDDSWLHVQHLGDGLDLSRGHVEGGQDGEEALVVGEHRCGICDFLG